MKLALISLAIIGAFVTIVWIAAILCIWIRRNRYNAKSVRRRVIGGTDQLRTALDDWLDQGFADLDDTYVITLYEQMLNDGSKVRRIGIRVQ